MTKSIEKLLEKKYFNFLNLFGSRSFRDRFISLVTDLSAEAESVWDYNSIRYSTVMNLKEWNKFRFHPQRRPYKSKILKSKPFDTKKKIIIELLRDAYLYYKSLKSSSYKKKLKASIVVLLESFTNAYYEVRLLRMADLYVGRSSKERDAGKVDPTQVTLNSLDYAIFEHCYFEKKAFKKLKNRVYKICKGRLGVLSDYYSTCQIDREFRDDLIGIFSILKRDTTLSTANIKIGWEIWNIFHDIGLDVNSYLELSDFPGFSTVTKKLLSFQSNREFVEELKNHMRDELPKCYEKYKKEGFVLIDDIYHEEAEMKDYPRSLRSDKQISDMVRECESRVFKYFPLVKKGSPTNILMNPMHPASTSRAFQSSTKNILENRVNVIVMTPRSDLKHTYLPTLAHEATHALHRIILEMGEKSKVLKPGSVERVPSSVMEQFSTLVDDQFEEGFETRFKKKYKGSEFPNFRSGLVMRNQVPYALTQLGIRKKFDLLIKSGVKNLSEDQIKDIRCEFDSKAKEWFSLGLNVVLNNVSSFSFFDSCSPSDGLVYMKKYIVDSTLPKQLGEGASYLADAFKNRFGKSWITSSQARLVLMWLLLESGRNYKTEDFSHFVMNKNLEKYTKELEFLGIQKRIYKL